jgi:hypothetical protein
MHSSDKQFSLKRQFYAICFLTFISILSIIIVDTQIDRTQEGKGLGLAIVNSLMSLHHGEINIES